MTAYDVRISDWSSDGCSSDLILQDDTLEHAFVAEAIGLPDEDYIADRTDGVDVDAIHAARKALRRQIATALRADFERLYAANRDTGAYSPDAAPAGRRALKNSALANLAALAEADAEIGRAHV